MAGNLSANLRKSRAARRKRRKQEGDETPEQEDRKPLSKPWKKEPRDIAEFMRLRKSAKVS